ncbi:MAG TPA: ParA family protein [Candidatus Krumholzibacterium sp.]|nr:ParA family protein [Candidatus Krumholzibacterium sp.]
MHRTETAAFLNQKGGVGKTTSVINTGAGLAILGKRVLLVDLDPQGHLTGFLGIGHEDVKGTVYDVLRGAVAPQSAVITRPLSAKFCIDGRESQLSISIIPSDQSLADAGMALSTRSERNYLLKNILSRISRDYDYVLLDCSPSLGLVSINALAAADKVFIPVQTEYLALKSLEDLLKKIEFVMAEVNLDLVIGGLIATRFDGRKILSRTVVESMKERFGTLFLDTIIRENIALAESPGFGKDIFSYRPRSNGASDYLKLALEIIGRSREATGLYSVERGVINSSSEDTSVLQTI